MAVSVCARALSFVLGGHTLLREVSLQVAPGQLCAIVGPSGAGKSTLLKLLCGIKEPSGGQALLHGSPAASRSRAPQLVGYVPQDDIVHRALTVERVLTFAAALRLGCASAAEQAERVEAVLQLLGLGERRAVRVRRLSGGQRKRVSIAVELIAQPALLFLDEPTSGLDPGLERQLMRTLRELASGSRTVLLTTHVMESMAEVDLLAVVYDGYLAYFGPPAAALPYFRVGELRDLFDQLPKRPAAAWSQANRRSHAAAALAQLPAESRQP